MPATLLDVNVLVALAWPNHVHHRAARVWFDNAGRDGWATTPITEVGFVRVSSNKRAIPSAASPTEALQVLRALTSLGGHEFWGDDSRLREPPFPLTRLGSYRQVTDLHLAAVAARNHAKLATFDRGIADALEPDQRHVMDLLHPNQTD